ncbi:MAG: hypothetical protein HQL80_09225 [Magnetococcales bacterium]|nr:hypothetical protein [Magnetococcales bacterium]
MSAKDAQKRRSQERAARKRAKSKPTQRRVAVMSVDAFRRVATPIASEVAKQRDISEDVVVAVMEQMAEEGCLGLDADGQLTAMDV